MAEEAKKRVELLGVKLMWASLAAPNQRNDNPKFEVELQSLSKDNIALLKQLDPPFVPNDGKKRTDRKGESLEHKGFYCTPRSNRPVPVYDSVPKKMQIEEVKTIGNESIGNVTVHSFNYSVSGNKGVALGLDSVQICKMKVFNDCSHAAVEGGHVSNAPEEAVEDNVPY
jgi:hypothetical protein